ncbi:MAG: substrate-binding domain-containing protein [Planctomycetota bacterium]
MYIPADDSYLELATQKGLVEETIPLARMQVGIAVRREFGIEIENFEQLLSPDIRLVQADPEIAAIGSVTRKAMEKSGRWERLAKATVAFRTTVNDVANDVQLTAADVGVVFDAILVGYPDLKFISIDELADVSASCSVGILRTSSNPEAARRFAKFLSASNRGQVRYREFGFSAVDGIPWEER